MSEEKIKARVTKSARVFVHNDLSSAVGYFATLIEEKQKAGSGGILIDGMVCMTLIAFTFEANVNFMGFEMEKAGKLPNWKERDPFNEKLKKVFGALSIPIEKDKRPHKTMENTKLLRDTLAHGKPEYREYDEIEIGTHAEIDWRSGADLLAGWQLECTPEHVAEASADLDELWKLMVEQSGLDLWDTITRGEGGIEFIEHVDPNTPSTVPKR
ncbi:hypothetical protein [Bradyrhizobium sp. 141]|uniref:hypothetical protein n=1 Tax=Bradyrhizobium sp. 141 TaxID=2782617 RepID=UPI001FF88DB5|nr:hypothetical protein [Bradyrhizobium sp. 141]MCK1723456.1 hypothetical protein [Bradyrhizobium sp. 141]